MATIVESKAPGWFWMVSGLFLLWNLMGCYACFSQLTMDAAGIATLPPAQRDAVLAMPMFAKAGFILGVGAGLLGALLLVMRNRLARTLFILSLVGVIIQFGWIFGLYGGLEKLGASAAGFPLFIAIVCMVEIWFSGLAARKGWLR